jgi:CDP-diacylglycerol--serine O-phosphatidyltransferase
LAGPALASLLDGLDGWLARRAGGASVFGAGLDVVADFTAFGVAPVVLVTRPPREPSVALWAVLGLFLCAALFRLLRTARLYGRKQPLGYLGLPMPAAGWLLLGLGLALPGSTGLMTGGLLLCALMVSRRPYPSPAWMRRHAPRLAVAALLIAAALSVFNWRGARLGLAAGYAGWPWREDGGRTTEDG